MRRPIRWWRDNDRNTEICPLFLQPVTVMRDESPITNTELCQGPALTTIYLFFMGSPRDKENVTKVVLKY